jgi:hypothetical protein
MRARYLMSLAAVAAAFFYMGCFPAAAQTAASGEIGSPIKPIMAAPVSAKTASRPSRASRKHSAKDVVHVYLLRGLLNVFSLGMDELAEKIRATGLQASVHNHTEWETLANEITAKYKAGNHAPIILIGHSLGADAVVYMAQYLGKRGIPVALLVPFDGTQTMVASSNVAHMMNITQRDYAYARRGSGFHGEFQNIDVTSMGVDHLSIDKAPRLHAMVLSKIASIVKRGEVPSNFATGPGGEREHASPAPHPAPEVAAKHEPHEQAKPEIETASKPAETPAPAKPETPAVAPVTATATAVAPAVPAPVAAPSVAAAASPASPAPVSAPAASAPKPVSAAPVAPAATPVAAPVWPPFTLGF